MNKKLIFFCMLTLLWMCVLICTHAQVRDSSIVWIDNKVMIVSSTFPNVLNLKTIQGFQTKKGTKYVTALLMLPDSTKVYNIKVEATAAGTAPPVLVTENIDNITSTRVGTWLSSASANSGHFNNTLVFSQTAGNTLTVSFTGVKVEWFTEKEKTHGIAAVSIDGGTEVDYDLYSPTNQKQVKIFEKDLTNGPHTFRLRNTGKKSPLNPATSNNLWITHDYLRVTKLQ